MTKELLLIPFAASFATEFRWYRIIEQGVLVRLSDHPRDVQHPVRPFLFNPERDVFDNAHASILRHLSHRARAGTGLFNITPAGSSFPQSSP
jgi:hypothetical protein